MAGWYIGHHFLDRNRADASHLRITRQRRVGSPVCFGSSVLDEGEDVAAGEFLAAVEEIEFNDEAEALHFAMGHFDELGDGVGGASGGKDIVNDDDVLAGEDGVGVHFEGVGTVFEDVFDADRFMGKLLGLADGDEAGVQGKGDGGGEEIAARFDADDDVDGGGAVMVAKSGNGFAEAGFIFEESGDVVEVDAGFREIGDFADELFEVVGGWGRIGDVRSGHEGIVARSVPQESGNGLR